VKTVPFNFSAFTVENIEQAQNKLEKCFLGLQANFARRAVTRIMSRFLDELEGVEVIDEGHSS